VLENFFDLFREIPVSVVLLSAFLLPALETAIFLGLLIPGELIVVAAGIRSADDGVPIQAVAAMAVGGAILGDSIGFMVGRHFRRSLANRLKAIHWRRAQEWLKRRGAPAIFLARFTAFLRSVMPPAVGASRMRYHVFLLWSIPAGILWGAGSALLGYYAARQSGAVLHWVAVAALVLITVFIVYTRLTHTKRSRAGRKPRAA
jgi:membrane protein DedA with SNARE-associated domain